MGESDELQSEEMPSKEDSLSVRIHNLCEPALGPVTRAQGGEALAQSRAPFEEHDNRHGFIFSYTIFYGVQTRTGVQETISVEIKKQ